MQTSDPLGISISNLIGKYRDTFLCSDCNSFSDAAYAAFIRTETISTVIGEYYNYGSWQPPRTTYYLVLDIVNKKAYQVTQQCVEMTQPNHYGFKSSCGFSARLETNPYTTDLAESLGLLHENGAIIYQALKTESEGNLIARAISIDISNQEVPAAVLPSAWDLVGANYNQNMVIDWYNNKTDYFAQIEFTGWRLLEGLGFIEGIRVPLSFSDGSTAWFSVDSAPTGNFGNIPMSSDGAFLVGKDTDFNSIFAERSDYSGTAFKFSSGGRDAFLKFVDALGRISGGPVLYEGVTKEGIESGKPVLVFGMVGGGVSIRYVRSTDNPQNPGNNGGSFDFGGLAPGESDYGWPDDFYYPEFPDYNTPEYDIDVGPATVTEEWYDCYTDPQCK
ncbi:hypothetical protein GCM10007426_11170 [Alloalcanivorax dieselolei]|nr:hypothetical protein GCM10007426_11170 [Alloalcanivorax dieselolei]